MIVGIVIIKDVFLSHNSGVRILQIMNIADVTVNMIVIKYNMISSFSIFSKGKIQMLQGRKVMENIINQVKAK